MLFQKDIALGNVGKLSLSEGAGVAKVAVTLSQELGGGKAAGALKGSATVEVDVEDALLVGLLFDYLAAKAPSISGVLGEAKVAAVAALQNS